MENEKNRITTWKGFKIKTMNPLRKAKKPQISHPMNF
jgi:hypothetical protein